MPVLDPTTDLTPVERAPFTLMTVGGSALDRLTDPDADPPGERARLRFAAGLVAMGTLHLLVPAPFRRIVPRWVPSASAAVAWSGVAEIASGVLVAVPRTRRAGGWLAAVTLVAVYPANVQMAVDATRSGRRAAIVATWLRVPLQLPLVLRALRYTR